MGRGRQGNGIEVHGPTLRVRFRYKGKRYAEPLSLKPTAANIKAAERLAAEVRQKIALGIFDFAATFPNSKNVSAAAPEATTLKDYAPKWLGTLTKAKSTKKGYTNAINSFWVPKLGSKALTDIRHTDCATAVAEKAAEGATGRRSTIC